MRALEWGAIVPGARVSAPDCLVRIHAEVTTLITRYAPHSFAMETIVYVQNHRTAILLGAARGAALLAAAQHGLPIHEYAPKRVKQGIVGRGAARKEQVAFMVRALLKLAETPEADAADALAIALSHFHAMDTHDRMQQSR